ncbi:MAG: LLM class flavin-dependent oxidoreductase [bacterium]|nr:LLM class flavin-dependent oxidoreductase [bacterium]
MKLGLSLPIADGTTVTGNVVARGARALEDHGFDSAWFFDSIGRGDMSMEPLTAAAVAATATQRISVGIGVLQVPLRHPVELAHRILTTQLLCEGRLVLGVGSGSTKGDFEAVGRDFDARFPTLDEGLKIMRRLWTGEKVGPADLTPLPAIQGGPPLLIGSWSGGRWIQKAAREFDGWIASAFFTGYDTLAKGLHAYRDAGGRRAIVTNISIDLTADEPLADGDNVFHLKCPPKVAAKRLGRLVELGFDEAVLVHRGPGAPDLAAIRALLLS